MKIQTVSCPLILFMLLILVRNGQTQPAAQPLTSDPAVKIGKMDNGLTYYIRENAKPENRVELRLVVRAGSVQETDDQQGLAHFLEHMCFNGTENFAKSEIVDFLESIGMGFGAHLNAYTSFDRTVYMLQVPTEDETVLDKAFQILEDWAFNVSNEEEEIDKERGVVIEEWRGRRGARQRIMDQQLPVLFKGSKYAERMPIGKKEIIDHFKPEVLRKFYEDWYRPDLMAVIAVGTLDADKMEALIRKHFDPEPAEGNKPELVEIPVPNHKETLVKIVTDPEATANSISVMYKHPPDHIRTVSDYRRSLVQGLGGRMFNARLSELAQAADAPFLGAYGYKSSYVLSKSFLGLGANVKDGQHLKGLRAALLEAERVRRHGFAGSELKRQKTAMLRGLEQSYNARATRPSGSYATDYVTDFASGDVSLGIETRLELARKLLPGISLEEINQNIESLMTEENRVILVDGPEKVDNPMPTEAELLAVFDEVAKADLEAWVDEVADQPLLNRLPKPARVVSRRTHEKLGIEELELSSGARVLLKPTDFQDSQILFSAWSEGGHSLSTAATYPSAKFADALIGVSGAGNFSLVQLQKVLAGKQVSLSPYIGEMEEGFNGNCAPEDLETLLQLVVLYSTTIRLDNDAIAAWKTRRKSMIENRDKSPEAAFSDSVRKLLSQDHPRRQPPSLEELESIDPILAREFYAQRFNTFDDFTFLIVGDFDATEIEPMLLKYFGELSETPDTRSWRDVGVRPPEGSQELTVRKGLEPKAQVMLKWWGDFEFNYPDRYAMQSMCAAMGIRLREVIREDLGGTYGIGVYPVLYKVPQSTWNINVVFGCDPDQVDKLVAAVQKEIQAIRQKPMEKIYLTKVKEQQRRNRETGLKQNNFWRSVIKFYLVHDEPMESLYDFDELVEKLSLEQIQATAEKYFASENHGTFLLLPEEKK